MLILLKGIWTNPDIYPILHFKSLPKPCPQYHFSLRMEGNKKTVSQPYDNSQEGERVDGKGKGVPSNSDFFCIFGPLSFVKRGEGRVSNFFIFRRTSYMTDPIGIVGRAFRIPLFYKDPLYCLPLPFFTNVIPLPAHFDVLFLWLNISSSHSCVILLNDIMDLNLLSR